VVNPTRGDVFKVLESDGTIAEPGHPFVILLVFGGMALVGNITDIENEGDIPCRVDPKDAPGILTRALP
jgi:hypothetical protein